MPTREGYGSTEATRLALQWHGGINTALYHFATAGEVTETAGEVTETALVGVDNDIQTIRKSDIYTIHDRAELQKLRSFILRKLASQGG